MLSLYLSRLQKADAFLIIYLCILGSNYSDTGLRNGRGSTSLSSGPIWC